MADRAAQDHDAPLVSIGIPTFNRAAGLRRAAASALGQTHRHLELVISDNGSSDETPDVCARLAASDQRVRVIRHPANRGPIANFNAVIDAFRGEYAVLLADDDWLDADYVSRCLSVIRTSADHALVAGVPRYHLDGRAVREGDQTELLDDRPSTRMRRYLRRVDDNGIFYGLSRTEQLRRSAPMPDVLGADWLLVAGLAFAGKVRTLSETHVNRSLGGTSQSVPGILATVRPRFAPLSRAPHLVTVAALFRDIAWRSPAYSGLPTARRLLLAARVSPAAMRWRGTAWLVLGPSLLRLARRRRARRLRGPLARVVARGGDPRPL
jgi:hypothetical protein